MTRILFVVLVVIVGSQAGCKPVINKVVPKLLPAAKKAAPFPNIFPKPATLNPNPWTTVKKSTPSFTGASLAKHSASAQVGKKLASVRIPPHLVSNLLRQWEKNHKQLTDDLTRLQEPDLTDAERKSIERDVEVAVQRNNEIEKEIDMLAAKYG